MASMLAVQRPDRRQRTRRCRTVEAMPTETPLPPTPEEISNGIATQIFGVVGASEFPPIWAFAHSLPIQLALVVLVPGLLALVFGWLAFRSRVTGVYLSILTQAMTLALSLYLFQNDSGLRGNNGLSGLQNLPGLGDVPQSVVSMWFFWASALALGLGYVLCAWLVSGKFGSVIRAIRDDEARVRFLGYPVEAFKLVVFTLTAVIAGVAGALYYPQAGIINPDEIAPIASIYLAVWVAIGGRGRLYGAVIGAAFVSLLSSWFTGGGAPDMTVDPAAMPFAAGQPVVNFATQPHAADKFGQYTGSHIGTRMAIVLDDTVYSAPVIRERISGGSAQISGSFTEQEATDLAIVLRAGSLPAPVKIMENRTVGPSLGQDSINQCIMSILIGSVLVILAMFLYYRLSGLVANLVLILNIVFIMAMLSIFGATLTLPGLAGIVLTVGMAVDANVLIFERIREELRLGRTARAALEAGYEKAKLTIIDANITTLIAALVLFQFGTGSVKGFAVTLSIGIISSLFTAVVVSRMIFDFALSRSKTNRLSI